ncbi:hypothetical protein C461_14363 [Halorubrum aidingense JCM 13560]|uniref:Uncharacterized protein n=1 Tax=Halorubrum aidingense JCM 13560 TaxID=1230454 RepID=M0P558_9EURY|nr:hypothetical protein [Halorubrum aidingense]EMA65287.1 hypothetical protein C461_14363 [Halorubrum aidingense JCM 13560]
MSLAAETREAVRARPFVRDALRAGLLNHSAAAAWLAEEADLDGDVDAIATALRRFREDLPDYATADRAASVSMRSGVGVVDGDGLEDAPGDASPLLRVGGAVVASEGRDTAILATGEVDAAALGAVLRRLAAVDVAVTAAGVAGDALVAVVGRRDGATAVRVVEDALDAVPTDGI